MAPLPRRLRSAPHDSAIESHAPAAPVPRITANTTPLPAAAPSVASDTARQFASFAIRTSRPSAAAKGHAPVARPFSHVEFAFFTIPVAPRKARPESPRRPCPSARSALSMRCTSSTMSTSRWCRDNPRAEYSPDALPTPQPAVVDGQRLNLRTTQIDSDSHSILAR